jgi:hypothetical protein
MTTTMTNPNTNGSTRTERKSLASQIDRLDEMLGERQGLRYLPLGRLLGYDGDVVFG